MQVLVAFPGDPEYYASSGAERRIPPPSSCPNCKCPRRPRLLGYYQRYVSAKTGEPIQLKIRRFRCTHCRRTVSLLPDFCLSYRVVRGESVARFLRGNGIDASDLRWHGLLVGCRKKFASWLPELGSMIHQTFGLHWEKPSIQSVWMGIEQHFGGWIEARCHVLSKCGVTLLGAYRCHRPAFFASSKGDHTPLLFSSGTDPPI
ncbi:MAG: DUF6431 domain-containing protein [Luteolibacter sp.]